MPEPAGSAHSRRRVLAWAVAGTAAAVLPGCTPGSDLVEPPERPVCVRRAELTRYRLLAGMPLVYEIDERRAAFWIEPGFAGQLEAWLDELRETTPVRPDQVWTYGTWTDGGSRCSSWHHAGRAFDLARLRLPGGEFMSCRYDRWRSARPAELRRVQRQYWAVAAGLHLHFAHVLTYLYNNQHHNHIHIDNGRSGSERSTFRARSPAQVQAVQAICRHLWNLPTEISGRWDAATRRATDTVLARIGSPDDLESGAGWATFLASSATKISED